jgi:hypothetical protein
MQLLFIEAHCKKTTRDLISVGSLGSDCRYPNDIYLGSVQIQRFKCVCTPRNRLEAERL